MGCEKRTDSWSPPDSVTRATGRMELTDVSRRGICGFGGESGVYFAHSELGACTGHVGQAVGCKELGVCVRLCMCTCVCAPRHPRLDLLAHG